MLDVESVNQREVDIDGSLDNTALIARHAALISAAQVSCPSEGTAVYCQDFSGRSRRSGCHCSALIVVDILLLLAPPQQRVGCLLLATIICFPAACQFCQPDSVALLVQ
jgi:hypothetical protein